MLPHSLLGLNREGKEHIFSSPLPAFTIVGFLGTGGGSHFLCPFPREGYFGFQKST